MNEIVKSQLYNANKMIQINLYQIYLQVILIADTSEGNSQQITENSMEIVKDYTIISKR